MVRAYGSPISIIRAWGWIEIHPYKIGRAYGSGYGVRSNDGFNSSIGHGLQFTDLADVNKYRRDFVHCRIATPCRSEQKISMTPTWESRMIGLVL